MKKTIYAITLLALIFSSCSKDEDVLAEQKVEISGLIDKNQAVFSCFFSSGQKVGSKFY